MASIIISGDVPPEVNEMVNNLLKGKISISQFIKFLHDNDLETKVRCNDRDINPSVLVDFIEDTLSTIFLKNLNRKTLKKMMNMKKLKTMNLKILMNSGRKQTKYMRKM